MPLLSRSVPPHARGEIFGVDGVGYEFLDDAVDLFHGVRIQVPVEYARDGFELVGTLGTPVELAGGRVPTPMRNTSAPAIAVVTMPNILKLRFSIGMIRWGIANGGLFRRHHEKLRFQSYASRCDYAA